MLCGNWTTMEKSLAALLTALLLISVILSSLSVRISLESDVDSLSAATDGNFNESRTCHTSACLAASSELIKTMDLRLDPCEDFTKFACDGFTKHAFFPNENAVMSKYSTTDDFMYLTLNNLFKQPIDPNEPEYSKLMKKYFKACRDVKAIESQGLDTIQLILKQLGGWPLIEGESWNEDAFEWTKSAYKAKNLGLPYELFLDVQVDKAPEVKLGQHRPKSLFIKPPTFVAFSLRNPELFLTETFRKSYFELILGVASSFRDGISNYQSQIDEMINLEYELYNISSLSKSDLIELPISELHKYSTSFPWFEYLSNITRPEVDITNDEKVYLRNGKYMENLEKLLSTTSKRTQANLFIWNIVFWALPLLHENIQLHYVNFQKVSGVRVEFSPRWLECTFEVLLKFKLGTTSLFARHQLKKNTTENIQKMADEIKAGILDRFGNSVGNGSEVEKKRNFLADINRTDVYVGFPNQITNEQNVDDYYKGLEFNTNNYLRLYMNLTAFTVKREFLGQVDSRFDWVEIVQNLFAMWHFIPEERNRLILTTGMLQGEFCNENLPKYMNYGALGFIIGAGYSYLYMKDFHDEPKCFPDSDDEKQKNVAEKILRDATQAFGLDEAYLTYLERAKHNEIDESLPKFDNFTRNQMFWIAHANSLCVKYRPQYAQNYAKNHRGKRVNVALKNSKYFAKDFNCAVGSKMNPMEKCIFL